MKYITTEKHPELKEGRIIDAEHTAYFVVDKNRAFIEDIEKGYIKEVEEKEFTKSEAKEAIEYCFNKMINLPYVELSICRLDDQEEGNPSDFFDKWLKQRNKVE